LLGPLLGQEEGPSKQDNAIVKSVLDGDCIRVQMLDFYGKEINDEKVFYISGSDSPDRGQPNYSLALEFLKEMIEGKSVRIEPVTPTPLFIPTANVFYKHRNLAELLILAGVAWPSQHSANELLTRYHNGATKGQRGMWKDGQSPDAPWEFRQRLKSVTVTGVITGDSFEVGSKHPKRIIRFFGVAAPWPYDPLSDLAREYLKKRIEGKTVQVDIKEDHRHLLIAKVTLSNKDIAAEMVGKGLLWYDQLTALTYTGLDQAATAAKKGNQGIWSREDVRAPWKVCKQPKNLEEWFIPKKPKPFTPKPETLVRFYKHRKTYLPFILKDVMVSGGTKKESWTLAISTTSNSRKRPKTHYVQLGGTVPGNPDWLITDAGFKEKPHPKLPDMIVRHYYIEVQHKRRSSRKSILSKGQRAENPIGQDRYQLAYFPTGKKITVSIDQEFNLVYKDLRSTCLLKKDVTGKIVIENTATRERIDVKPFNRQEFQRWKMGQTKTK
jgi:endonuclease YncB( thermonuclease family)